MLSKYPPIRIKRIVIPTAIRKFPKAVKSSGIDSPPVKIEYL
jgi:hypothetical protein